MELHIFEFRIREFDYDSYETVLIIARSEKEARGLDWRIPMPWTDNEGNPIYHVLSHEDYYLVNTHDVKTGWIYGDFHPG